MNNRPVPRSTRTAVFLTGGATQAPVVTIVIAVIAVVMAIIHIVQGLQFFLPSGQFKNLHLGLSILILLLGATEALPPERRAVRLFWMLLAIISLAPMAYIHWEYDALVQTRTFLPNQPDMVMGVLLLGLALIAAGQQWGWTIPVLGLLGLLYGYYGDLLPGYLLSHAGISFQRLIAYSSIPYFQGLLGNLTGLSADTIFMFMLLSGVLKATGGIDFIIRLSYAIGGRTRAGPAQVAVVASGLMGMISGSTVANVASTGALTIPMMRRFGFRPAFAGAVEAVASTGGQLTPPVMGLAAFLIVGVTGIPYLEIIAAAALPALVYYVYLMVAVHIRAAKFELNAKTQDVPVTGPDGESLDALSLREVIMARGHLLVGVAGLIYFLLQGLPAGTAALYSVLMLLAIDVLRRLWTNRHAPAVAVGECTKVIVRGLVDGARSGATVAVVIAVIGILVEVLTITGFAQKLSNTMLDLAGGELVPLLLIAAGTCLAFGLGLPTSAAYFLVALLGAPALVTLGIPILAAHLFVFYFANVSAITPPIAIASMVAANIAGAKFLPTALLSVRLGLPGFLLPFLFIAHPEILGLGDTPFLVQILFTVIAGIAVISLNVAMEGFLLSRLNIWERVLLLPAAFGLLYPGWAPTLVGFVLLAAVVGRQLSRSYLLARRRGAREASR